MSHKKIAIPAYIGLLLILGCIFFPHNGECAEIKPPDPPAHWKVASKLKKEWKNRKLLVPSEEIPEFPSKAIVVLAYFERMQQTQTIGWPKVGFAIGDGTLILTAAHCVDDFNRHCMVISPYYGDIFEFEILAVDEEADLAILKAPWPAHPALALASEEELEKAQELFAVGYPTSKVRNPQDKIEEPPYNLLRKIRMERLPARIETGKATPGHAITLKGTRFIGPGWSGSAIVLPKTGKAVGIVCGLEAVFGSDVITKIFGIPLIRKKGLLKRRDAKGCGIQSILALLKQHNLESAAQKQPELEPVDNADQSFSLAMDYIEAYLNKGLIESLPVAQELAELRSESVPVRLFLANSAFFIYLQDSSKKDLLALAESNFKEALRLDPDSANAHSYYANLLTHTERYEEALAETEATLTIDPNNQLAIADKMLILAKRDPAKAEELGQRLTKQYPDNAHYWSSYSDVLINLDRNEEALEAAQRAVETAPEGLYRGRLATALEGVGRLDEAEENYQKMTGACGCQNCWFKYSRFLITHRLDKLDEAEKALNSAAESRKKRGISEESIANLRYNLIHVKFKHAEKQSPKKAETLARKWLEESPKNAQYWFELAGILRTLGKYQEALQAAQNAVDLAPERSYRPRLANILAKTGDLEKAEQTYKEMLHDYPERAKYWFWYAEFLSEYHPDRTSDAREALSEAQLPGKSWPAPADELNQLRKKLYLEPPGIADCNELSSAAGPELEINH